MFFLDGKYEGRSRARISSWLDKNLSLQGFGRLCKALPGQRAAPPMANVSSLSQTQGSEKLSKHYVALLILSYNSQWDLERNQQTSHIPTRPLCQVETTVIITYCPQFTTVWKDLVYLKFMEIQLEELFCTQWILKSIFSVWDISSGQ